MTTVLNGASPMAIYSGRELIIHQGGEESRNILPQGIARGAVEAVKREIDCYKMCERLIVIFRNGHTARIDLHMDRLEPISEDQLKEFQAVCLMVHDL